MAVLSAELGPAVADFPVEVPTTIPAQPKEVLDGCRTATQRLGGPAISCLGVTSALRGEGRSTVAIGLARIQQMDHTRRTVLVDLDLEKPTLHELLQKRAVPGVAELASGRAPLHTCMHLVEPNLWLIPAGQVLEGGAARIISAFEAGAWIEAIMSQFDVLIADLPPIFGTACGLQAANLSFQTVLVARAGITPLPQVKKAAALLHRKPKVILNGTNSATPRWLQRLTAGWS